MSQIESVKSALYRKVDFQDIRELHDFLGVEFIKVQSGAIVSQEHYVTEIIGRFCMLGRKFVSTPMVTNKVDLAESNEPEFDKLFFKKFLALCYTSHREGGPKS